MYHAHSRIRVSSDFPYIDPLKRDLLRTSINWPHPETLQFSLPRRSTLSFHHLDWCRNHGC